MICFNQPILVVALDSPFNKNLVKKKSRDLILKNFPNKKRRFYFLSNPSILKNKNMKSENFLNFNQFKFLKNFGYFLSYTYVLGYICNFMDVFLGNGIISIEKIFNILNSTVFVLILLGFFSGKKFEKDFLNKILTSYIYFNLVWITEKCIVLSGAENTWIFFKVINNFILTSNIWFGNNCITGYSILNKNQNYIFWQIQTSFTALFTLDTIFKIFFSRFPKICLDEVFNFPDYSFYMSIFLRDNNYLKMIIDLWVFSTLSSSLMIITFLIFIYFIAFVKSDKNFMTDSQSIKKFLFKNLSSKKLRSKKMNIPITSISNLNSSKSIDERTIEELLKSEKKNPFSNLKEDTIRWKVKKKGIKTPFSESVWNNELPLLKQNLWYEIKSR